MSRDNQEWTSWSGYRVNEHFKYTFPDGKHTVSEFEDHISGTGELIYSNYSVENKEMAQSSGIYANFQNKTDVK